MKRKIVNTCKKFNIEITVFSIILLLLCVYYVVLNDKGYVLGPDGSSDYWGQHVPLLEMFRTDFMKTHDFIPQLIFSIGGIQSFGYLIYYGALSPLTFLSYLFFQVDTIFWMQIQQIIIIFLSLVFSYIFIRKFSRDKYVAISTAFLTTIVMGSIQCTSTSIMFIYPLPFILLGLIGLQKRNSFLFIISAASIFYLNFMAAHVSFLIFLIYYVIFEFETYYLFFKKLIRDYFIAALIAMPVILTQIYIIFSGSRNSNKEIVYPLFNKDFIDLLTSNHLDFGMPIVALFCFLSVFIVKDKKIKLLSFILLILFIINPINYIINAGEYIMYRQSILYTPFFSILFIYMIQNKSKFIVLLGLIFSTAYTLYFILYVQYDSIFTQKYEMALQINIIFLILTFITILLIIYTTKTHILFSVIYFISLFFLTNNFTTISNEYVTQNISNCENPVYSRYTLDNSISLRNHVPNQLFESCNLNVSSYLSLSNENMTKQYQEVYNLPQYASEARNIYSTDLVHDKLMGVRYIMNENGDVINTNDNINPLFYTVEEENVYKWEESFLKDPLLPSYNLVDNNFASEGKNTFTQENYGATTYYPKEIILDNKKVGKFNGITNTQKGVYGINIKLSENICNEVSIKLEDIYNNKSKCNYMYFNSNYNMTYWIDSEDLIDGLDYEIGKGQINIEEVEVIFIAQDKIETKTYENVVDDFIYKNDAIELEIENKKDMYFMTSIPYDKGFDAFVNGKEVEIEKVNGNFLGFKVPSGHSEIKLNYKVPYLSLGITICIITIICTLIYILYRRWT